MTPIARVTDLSHYDDVQDKFAGAVKMGIWGVINKCTEGVGSVDKSFEWRRGPAAAAELYYGGYHFLRPGRIEQQVVLYLEHMGALNNMLMALDYEDQNVPLRDARAWLELVHDKTGRWAKFYLGGACRDKLPSTARDKFWSNLDLWHAQYGPRPSKVPTAHWPKGAWLWQYTGDGIGPNPHTVPGINPTGKLDINHYAGTRDDLAKQWAS